MPRDAIFWGILLSVFSPYYAERRYILGHIAVSFKPLLCRETLYFGAYCCQFLGAYCNELHGIIPKVIRKNTLDPSKVQNAQEKNRKLHRRDAWKDE